MNKIILVLINLILFLGSAYSQDKVLLDKIVAQVGSEVILMSEIESELSYMKSINRLETDDDEAKCMLLEQIMIQKLLIDQATIDSIKVSDDQIERDLNLRMDNVLGKMGGDEELFKQYYGKTVAEMKHEYRDDIKNKILAESMQQKLMNNINITPSEVETFFKSIPEDSLPYFNSEVELSQIIIKPEVNKWEKKRAYDYAAELKERVENGEDFSEIAKKYSNDPGSASNGGDLGWITRGKLVPEFEAVAYGLKKNEISDIVETGFGFHIIKLLERRGNSIHAKHILVKPNITVNDLNETKSQLDSIREMIIADSISFEEAVKKYSFKKSMSYNNNGRMTNPMTQSTFFEMKDLPPDIYFAIENLNEGDITATMETTDQMGETIYQIIKLNTKTDPHKANLKMDYSRIQTYAKNGKKNEYINKWVLDKIKSTYFRVDKSYRTCPNIARWFNESKN